MTFFGRDDGFQSSSHVRLMPSMDKRAQIPSAASFFTPSLPLLNQEQALSLASGYLPARPPTSDGQPANNAHLYFVLERARHVTSQKKLIIWLNGGPGCSSFDGLMIEIGAFRPDMKGGLEWTKPGGAWNEYADVIYLDQPVGTGFSYVNSNGYTRTLEQAADELVYFLDRLIEVYPEYARGNGVDAYIAGESYAGQYIPFSANALIKKGSRAPVDLKGIVIGNGFIDPIAQSGTELEMMIESKVWSEDSEDYRVVKQEVDECKASIARGTNDMRSVPSCGGILSSIIERTKARTVGRDTCINIYDVRLSDSAPACGMNWPPTLSATYDYLKREDVRRALHVDSIHKPEAWVECNHRVGGGIDSDSNGKAAVVHLPTILEAGVPVLLFAGDQDLICNHIGVERIPDRLKWGGQGWGSPEKKQWYVNNELAGYWRSNRNMTFVSIAKASHMVGVDKPVEAHDMMLRFMGVDLMDAAGPSARIPSRLDGEQDRVLVVAGGGNKVPSQNHSPMIPGVSGKTEAQVAEEAKWEAYYNAGSAALIVLLILVGAGTCILLRLRRKARLSRKSASPYLPSGEEGEHEMERFIQEDLPSDENLAEDDNTRAYSDETYRLDATTASNTRANGRRTSAVPDGAASDEKNERNANSIAHRDAEQIFDVGDESDDDLTESKTHRAGEAVRFA